MCAPTSQPQRRNLKALTGMRTLATLWIVLGHFQQTAQFYGSDAFVLVLGRGFIPVGMYIILSGFVTHYAYQKKRYKRWSQVWQFYLRRMCRVLFSYIASVVLGLLDPLFTNHDALVTDHPQEAVATIFLVQSWFELPKNTNWDRDKPTQPNPAGWTISTLIFAWLLYPVMNKLLRMYGGRTKNQVTWKLVLAIFLYLLAMLPCIIIATTGDGGVSHQEFELLYKFPPLRLADFALGAVLAELVDHPECNKYNVFWRWVPDVTLILFAAIVVFWSLDGAIPTSRDGLESILISGLSPLMGLMLLGYSINSESHRRWSFSAILEHPVLTEFGNWSFPVYCFQYSFFFMFEAWQRSQTGIAVVENGELKLVAAWLMPYLIALYLFCAMWTALLEKPFAEKVKIWTAKVFDKSEESASKSRQASGERLMLDRTQPSAGTISTQLSTGTISDHEEPVTESHLEVPVGSDEQPTNPSTNSLEESDS